MAVFIFIIMEKAIKIAIVVIIVISNFVFVGIILDDKVKNKQHSTIAKETSAKTQQTPLYQFTTAPMPITPAPKIKVDTVYIEKSVKVDPIAQYTPANSLPANYYYGLGSLYDVPVGINQTSKSKDSEVKIKSEEKKIVLSYSQKAGGKETNFSLEATNPTKAERVELYKLFVHEAREAQEALRSYKQDILVNEDNSIIKF